MKSALEQAREDRDREISDAMARRPCDWEHGSIAYQQGYQDQQTSEALQHDIYGSGE